MNIDDIIKEALEARVDEHVTLVRELFYALEPEIQARELRRFDATARGLKTVIVSPLDDNTRAYRFISMNDCLEWFKKNVTPNANSANMYKAIRQERNSAYGYTFRYED